MTHAIMGVWYLTGLIAMIAAYRLVRHTLPGYRFVHAAVIASLPVAALGGPVVGGFLYWTAHQQRHNTTPWS
jgi:ABC-type sulfate transport system permease component